MDKTKVLLIVGACGFVLSLLTGLIFKVSFGIVILRALLFAILFIGIAAFGQFIFERFLDNPSSPIAKSFDNSNNEQSAKGQFIDIKVEDTVFPNEENAPLFQIPKELKPDWSNQTDNSSNSSKAENSISSSKNAGEPLFSVPSGITSSGTNLLEENSSKTAQSDEQLFTPAQNNSANANNEQANVSVEEELGTLPDMGSMLSDMQNASNDDIIVNSDFANSGDTVRSGAMQNADTEIIAKAIHTVLTRDKS